MALDTARIKAWARKNKRTLALGGGVLAVVVLALVTRGRGGGQGGAGATEVPVGDGTADTAGLSDLANQFGQAINDLADRQQTQFEQLAAAQSAQSDAFGQQLADLYSRQDSYSRSVTDLFSQQAAAQQASTDALTKQFADALKAATTPKPEPKPPAAPKPAAKPAPKPAPKPAAKPAAKPKTKTVTVKSGDNLWNLVKAQYGGTNTQIANKVNEVAKANNLSNPNLIKPGQKLKI